MKNKKILFLVAILFLALFFSFNGQAAPDCESGFEPLNGVCFPMDTDLSESTVKEVIVAVLTWLLEIFGALGILTFIISSIYYFTAAGDPEQEKKAKKAMTMGIIGIAVGLGGFVVIQAIDAALRAGEGF